MEHLETEDDIKNHKYKTSNNYMELKQPPTGDSIFNFTLNNFVTDLKFTIKVYY